jgi:hypothetical protein
MEIRNVEKPALVETLEQSDQENICTEQTGSNSRMEKFTNRGIS